MARQRKIPKFKDIDDMAQFWDENDITEFDHAVEKVSYEPKRVVLSVRFDPDDAIVLSREARRLGVDRSTLVRMIVRRVLKDGRGEEAATVAERR